MKNKRNLLVTLADKKYLPQAKQLFSSVYWNAGWDGDYMLLSHDNTEEDLRWFRDKGILIKECMPLHDKSTTYVYAPVVLDKYYLFTEEFKKWKNIVFLDSDIIVKGPLERLTKTRYFGAVRDIFYNKLVTQFFNPEENIFNNNTYNFFVPAFNSGVFSFNTDIITPNMFHELNKLFADHFRSFKYLDQATLNLYFYKKWEKLPVIFNTYIAIPKFKLPEQIKTIIIHFVTCPDHPKLWDPGNSFYNEWKKNLDKAELIDLQKIQKVHHWSPFKIKFYDYILKIYLYKYVGRYRLKEFFYYKLKSFFVYKIKSFAKSFFSYLINTPGRLIGKFGLLIKKMNPDLYQKIKKIKR